KVKKELSLGLFGNSRRHSSQVPCFAHAALFAGGSVFPQADGNKPSAVAEVGSPPTTRSRDCSSFVEQNHAKSPRPKICGAKKSGLQRLQFFDIWHCCANLLPDTEHERARIYCGVGPLLCADDFGRVSGNDRSLECGGSFRRRHPASVSARSAERRESDACTD